MRQETKLIKEILKREFPNQKFKFQYRQAINYADSSDKLKITCEKDSNVESIIKCITRHTQGIDVYKKGSVGMIVERYGSYNNPYILSVTSNEWVDADVLEFIEVGIE